MTADGWWGLAGGLLGLAGYSWYIPDTLRGHTDPDPMAWLAWTAQYGALLAAQAAAGAGAALWLPALQLAGTLIVCVLTLRKTVRPACKRSREKRRTMSRVLGDSVAEGRGNAVATVAVAASLALWWVTSSPAIAIVCVLAVEGHGMVRTVVKVWRRPASESRMFWVLCVIGGLCAVQAAGPHPPPPVWIYLGFFVVMGASVVAAGSLGSRRSHGQGRAPAQPRGSSAGSLRLFPACPITSRCPRQRRPSRGWCDAGVRGLETPGRARPRRISLPAAIAGHPFWSAQDPGQPGGRGDRVRQKHGDPRRAHPRPGCAASSHCDRPLR